MNALKLSIHFFFLNKMIFFSYFSRKAHHFPNNFQCYRATTLVCYSLFRVDFRCISPIHHTNGKLFNGINLAFIKLAYLNWRHGSSYIRSLQAFLRFCCFSGSTAFFDSFSTKKRRNFISTRHINCKNCLLQLIFIEVLFFKQKKWFHQDLKRMVDQTLISSNLLNPCKASKQFVCG